MKSKFHAYMQLIKILSRYYCGKKTAKTQYQRLTFEKIDLHC